MNKIFIDKTWSKNWSGNWGLLFGSLYGKIYTQGLEDLTKKHFKHNLVVFEKGSSANYLAVDELKDYCAYLVNLIKNDETLPQKFSEQVIKNTDKIFDLMKKLDLKDKFTKEDYDSLQESRLVITTANFSLKKVIDYLPKELMEKYLSLFTKVRLYTEPVYNETDRILTKIAKYFFKDKLDYSLIPVITEEEMQNFFSAQILPDKEELSERLLGCALLYDSEGKNIIYKGEDYKEIISTITDKLSRKQIKGMVAFRGKATGKVRVVLDPQECNDFNEGDILVAGMTRPEYLGLMKKSAAFITDAGGLLSHAAIVARELKKPCVIGTEVATKVLKDGDMVEVDAEKGIINKLN